MRDINGLEGAVNEQNIQDITNEINALVETDMPHPHEDLYNDYDFLDAVTGKPLDHRLAA